MSTNTAVAVISASVNIVVVITTRSRLAFGATYATTLPMA